MSSTDIKHICFLESKPEINHFGAFVERNTFLHVYEMLHALGLLFIEYKIFAKRVASICFGHFWPFLLRVGNLPRSTLPLQE